MTIKTLYSILEVAPSASIETIEAAYRALSEKLAGPSGELIEARRKAVQEAYKTLSEPTQRARYDLTLAQKASPARVVAARPIMVEEPERPWFALPLIALVMVAIVVGAGLYYRHEQRLENERIARLEEARRATEQKAEEERLAASEARRLQLAEAGRRYDRTLRKIQDMQARQLGNQSSANLAYADRSRQNEQAAREREEAMERRRADIEARQRVEMDKQRLRQLEAENNRRW